MAALSGPEMKAPGSAGGWLLNEVKSGSMEPRPTMLGGVIEVVSGMDLDRFVEERVTKPLGMTSTGFYVSATDRDRVAQPQTDPATGRRPPMFDPTQKPKLISAGAGGLSTAPDYLLFCQMLLHGSRFGNTHLLAPLTIKPDDLECAWASPKTTI
jgi:CubicO group peptidase (beta-lactamase class C family)